LPDAASSGPTPALLESLGRDVTRARTAIEHVDALLYTIDREGLGRAWFAPRVLAASHRALADEMEAFVSRPLEPEPALCGDARPASRVTVPVDPRTALEVGAVSTRVRELHDAMERAWAYTTPSPSPGVSEPALRVRVVAEGSPQGGYVVAAGGGLPPRGVARGLCAILDRAQVL
jgi:hypothetical protein